MPALSPQPPASNNSIAEPTTPATMELDVKPNISELMGPKSESSLNQV